MKLVMSLSALHSKMLKRLESQLSIHGISFTEFLVMYQLNQAPGNTMRRIELAENIGLSASGVTRLLAPMEKRKMCRGRLIHAMRESASYSLLMPACSYSKMR